jgi:uncharacterized protein (TIGR02172 family)
MDTYKQIDLNEYVQTGEGGTALTYNHKDGKTLAKLFMPGMGAEQAEREFKVNQVVYDMGLPTPKPIRLVTDGTRFGAEYELIQNKRSFARIISQEPEQLEPLSILFAKLAKQLHAKEADTAHLHSMKELAREQIARYEAIPLETRKRALAALDEVPDATTCLHGDLHIGNIITDGKRNLWIDVGDFAYGCPEWDLCTLFFTTHNLREDKADEYFHVTPDVLKKHWDIFASVYFETADPEVLQSKGKLLYHFFALHLLYVIGKTNNAFGAPIDYVVKQVNSYLLH